MKKKRDKKKIKIAEMLEMPKDVTLGEAIITLIGKREILIENYKGIIEYNDEYIKIATKNGNIQLNGTNFIVTYLTNEEIKITGDITKINY
jgi:sporulation protein YqfC